MNRLTFKDRNGNWGLKGVPWEELREGRVLTEETRQKLYGALCKLKDYEDTGEEPWQIGECNELFDKIFLRKCREVNRLKKEAAEQGKLLKLPCAVGDTVYVIPSKTNYKLNILNGHRENNRVYKQVVNRIEVSKNGYLLSTCDGMASVADVFYKETWFLTQEEAEAALKKYEH